MMKVSSLPYNAVAPMSKQQIWINFISPQCNFNVCNWQTREKYEPHKLMTRFLGARDVPRRVKPRTIPFQLNRDKMLFVRMIKRTKTVCEYKRAG